MQDEPPIDIQNQQNDWRDTCDPQNSPLITTKTGNFAVGNACYREQPNTVCVDTGSIDKSTVLIEKAAFWYTTGIAMHKTYT